MSLSRSQVPGLRGKSGEVQAARDTCCDSRNVAAAKVEPVPSGFTLLEVTLVLLIMAMLVTVAVPLLPSVGRTRLEAAADRLATTMTYLADEASLSGRIYRLTIDIDDSHWDVAALAPYAATDGTAALPEFHEDPDDPLAKSTDLPPDVTIDAVIDTNGETSAGSRAIWFLPEGLPESVRVRFGESGGATTTVLLDATREAAWREETEEPQ
ncbi:MAG TPA: GspH/FimT family pseudopilin [Candidatus Binatia bacterium]|jgi:prepilin-type N-terminal cleavage/methylation domain-containing protein